MSVCEWLFIQHKGGFFLIKKNNKKIDCLVQLNGTGLHGLHHGLHDGTGSGLKTEHFSVVEGKNSIIMNRI